MMTIDPKFVELTGDVVKTFYLCKIHGLGIRTRSSYCTKKSVAFRRFWIKEPRVSGQKKDVGKRAAAIAAQVLVLSVYLGGV